MGARPPVAPRASAGRVSPRLALAALAVGGIVLWFAGPRFVGIDDGRGARTSGSGGGPGGPRPEAATEAAGRTALPGASARTAAGPATAGHRSAPDGADAQGLPVERAPAKPAAQERRRIEELLEHPDVDRRLEGLRQLQALAPEESVPRLAGFVRATRGDPSARLHRLEAVTRLGALPHGERELHELYRSEGAELARAVAVALARHGDHSLLERELFDLRFELASPDDAIRARAAQEAAGLASPASVPVLLPLLADTSTDVRAHAIAGLGWSGDLEVIDELRPLLADPEPMIREQARQALEALRRAATPARVRGDEPR